MTRDSNGWLWIIAGSILTAVASRLDLIDPLVPVVYHPQAHALIELLAMVVGIVAGLARMSPLPISNEGRRASIREKSETLDRAASASLDAAVKVEKAVGANIAAAQAAEDAKDLSEKAAGQ